MEMSKKQGSITRLPSLMLAAGALHAAGDPRPVADDANVIPKLPPTRIAPTNALAK